MFEGILGKFFIVVLWLVLELEVFGFVLGIWMEIWEDVVVFDLLLLFLCFFLEVCKFFFIELFLSFVFLDF